jgi:hypothetical protein
MRIWIRIQHLKWIRIQSGSNPDPIRIRVQSGSRILKAKNVRKNTQMKIFFVSSFYHKLQFTIPRPSYSTSKLQKNPSASEHPAPQKMKFINFLYFCGWLLPSWIRIALPSWIRIANPDSDPRTPLNPDSRYRSGSVSVSTTKVFSDIRFELTTCQNSRTCLDQYGSKQCCELWSRIRIFSIPDPRFRIRNNTGFKSQFFCFSLKFIVQIVFAPTRFSII